MCGIFAYTGPGAPDPANLVAAAEGASRRGPHGHGWVTSTQPGVLTARHQLGALADESEAVAAVTAPCVLGHARLATSTADTDLTALQPVIIGGHALAHNGHVYGAPQDADDGHSDTVALARLYDRLRQRAQPIQALADLVRCADQRAWAIVVLDRNGRLYAHRHYHPLYWWRSSGGTYLSSQARHANARALPSDRPIDVGEVA